LLTIYIKLWQQVQLLSKCFLLGGRVLQARL
jgi:hypothetical protein